MVATHEGENGVRFEGDERLDLRQPRDDRGERRAAPEGAAAQRTRRASTSRNDHHGNFLDCVRSRKATICPAEVGHRSVSVCHLGNISLRLGGRRLEWDSGEGAVRGRRRGQPDAEPADAGALEALACLGYRRLLALAGCSMAILSFSPRTGAAEAGSGATATLPPPGAVMLFEGKELEPWRTQRGRPAAWPVADGADDHARRGDIMSQEKFIDFQLHVEFRVPNLPDAKGQEKGNSGVYSRGGMRFRCWICMDLRCLGKATAAPFTMSTRRW